MRRTQKKALLVELQQGLGELRLLCCRQFTRRLDRPAGAGMVVPVMMQRGEHVAKQL